MGPGTVRCLAHSAWPMLWVRQCALSPYPLLARLSIQPLCAWRQTPWQWRPASQRCGLILDHEEDPARASECRLREPIGASDLSTRRCAEHEKNLLFSASRTARAKQHASPQRSGAQFEQGYACLRPVRAVGCSIRACSDSCSTKGCRMVRLSILSVVIAFSQYFIILTCVRCVNTLFVPQERPASQLRADRGEPGEAHPESPSGQRRYGGAVDCVYLGKAVRRTQVGQATHNVLRTAAGRSSVLTPVRRRGARGQRAAGAAAGGRFFRETETSHTEGV